MRIALLAGATGLAGSGAGAGAGTWGATIAAVGGGLFGGEDSQPASKHKTTTIAPHFASGWIFSGGSLKCRIPLTSIVMEPLFWLLLEAGVALALLLAIVWWTWPRKKPRDRNRTDDAGR